MPWADSICNFCTMVIGSLEIQRDRARSKSVLWLSSSSKTKMVQQACILQWQSLWSDYQPILNKYIPWETNHSHAVGIGEDRRQNLFLMLAEVWDIASMHAGCLEFNKLVWVPRASPGLRWSSKKAGEDPGGDKVPLPVIAGSSDCFLGTQQAPNAEEFVSVVPIGRLFLIECHSSG